ncbi:YihY/virulence factor BrkB family protein [Jeotgalicoccus sp. ATCC 8456]|uniref:YihY/virulence factor BrkB family protein n=1 Tax=Jeotgalicoccus sp. ATCC 8456 TaxID=946435 RepID=UPI0018E6116D|nr:YihY/virulence factor BrkB family protein [Jeotgalicoccus sp. ATCC 8456]QQD85075.1 YihY/virulence factor BrkB family protein [Jeotgalicoccus sp. ATCC 8456]
MSKDKSSSKLLNQIKNNTEEEKDKNDVFVDKIDFKSVSSKDKEHVYVSKINKPAKVKDESGFFNQLLFRFSLDNTSGMAAQLAYYFLLAIFPLLIFLLSIVPLFQIQPEVITGFIQDYAPAEISSLLEGIIGDVLENSGGGTLSLGLILTLWSASNGMTALMNAFNVAYDVEDNRNFFVTKSLSVFFTLILSLSVILTFVLIVFGGQIGDLMFGVIGLDDQFQYVWSLIRSILPVLLVLIVFLIMYVTAPNIKLKLKSVIPGTIFTTIAFLVASWGFSFYVSNFSNYSATYGSIAGVIILIFWLYITGVIIILGAQINSILYKRELRKKADNDERQKEYEGDVSV